ncbi:MAG: rhodanese-like domain-containing protein [Actinomycetia bacterium]|nr:rhodanese-like domain-containing protein [Actinomycetes bacterium]
MKRDKFLIIFSLMISIILLSFFSVSGCKIIEEISKEEISPTEKSEQDPETETEEDVSNIVEKEEIPEIILISPAEVYEIITNNEDYIILDVRTQEEYSEGHLDKALLIPVDELEERIDELPGNKPIIVYCRSGVRSNRAAGILIDNGFTKVYDMGGILGWQEEGLPVIVGNNTEEILEFKTITVDEAYEIFLDNEDYIFIDVRSEDEYKSGHIEGAIHIPVTEIEERLGEIPDDKSIIVYCNGSGCDRSGRAARILTENGFNQVYDLVGRGIFEWEEKGYPI